MDEEETEEKVKPSISSKLPFQRIATLCERISKTQGKDKKKDVMKKFISDWRAEHKRIHGDAKTDDSFFPVMRFFLPHLDKDRLSYGMKEVVLAKYYIEALTLSKDSDDAKRILNYRAPSSAKQDAGDFASVVYAVLSNRCPEKGSLTVDDINNSLDLMAQSNAEGRRDITKKEIQKVIRNTNALEQKWLIRIMLKEMKLGLNENSVLPIFHPEALELYNVCNSLSKVCVDLHNINTKLNETEIMLCTPFRPMLGQRAAIDEVSKIIPQNIFIIETKIDGERMQLHKNGNEFRYFSRNSNDYTQSFGATRYRGTLTPYISDSFKTNIRTCILDGEMVGYDPATNDFVLKGSNVDIKSDNLTGCHPCFVAFDVLLINDENLANVSLKERIQKLEGVFDVTKGRIQHVERKIGSTSEDVVAAVNDAIDRRDEGIVIKDPTSCYKPSKRKGSGWLKIKPEYVDSLSDELDLIILGGQYGSGHRGGMISHFLLGVADKQDESEKHPKTFLTFGKVGSGYSDAELKSLLDKLRKHWVKFDARNPPKNIQFSNGFKEKPDVVISPENSVIVQIKAAEISTSDKYKCGCTLRFPRVEKIRDDKDWFDCMTFKELEDLKQIADGKLTYLNTDGVTSEPAKKKRRVAAHFERPRTVAEHFKGADVSSIQEVSQLFADKEFCVINGPAEHSKQDIEKKIVECGGRFVQNPSADTVCVLAHKTNFRTKNIINRGSIDVVATSWILECFEKQSLIPYQPSDMLFATEKTQAQFRKQFDHYGDNYMEDVTEEALKEIFEKMDELSSLSNKEIADLEEKYFVNNSKEGLFRTKRLFVPEETGNDGDKLAYAEQEFLYHGGEKSDSLEKASHVLVQQSISQEKLSDLRSHIRKFAKKPYLITKNWIYDSVDAARLLNEGPYEP